MNQVRVEAMRGTVVCIALTLRTSPRTLCLPTELFRVRHSRRG